MTFPRRKMARARLTATATATATTTHNNNKQYTNNNTKQYWQQSTIHLIKHRHCLQVQDNINIATECTMVPQQLPLSDTEGPPALLHHGAQAARLTRLLQLQVRAEKLFEVCVSQGLPDLPIGVHFEWIKIKTNCSYNQTYTHTHTVRHTRIMTRGWQRQIIEHTMYACA